MRTLVVGHNGMLGTAVCRALRERGVEPLTFDVRWGTPAAADDDLAAALGAVTAGDGPWRVLWCAGAGVTATPQHVFDAELVTFRRFCDAVAASGRGSDGTFFFTSSAGGLYAGSAEPPFTEHTPVAPLAPYGHAKVALEAVAAGLAEVGVRVVIARVANLYGPGQDLTKPQGLVSQLCLSLQTRRPLGIYVSLDTLRDYVYVDDAARTVADMVDRAATLPAGSEPVIKIVASHQSTSIAELLGELRLITKRRPPVVLAASPQRKVQARDLRMRSVVWPDLDRRQLTPFPAGVAACLEDVSRRWRTADAR